MLAVIVVQVQNDQCVRIAECCKDIKGHLRTCGVSDSSLNSEATLLLARAGKVQSKLMRFFHRLAIHCKSIRISRFAQGTATHLV